MSIAVLALQYMKANAAKPNQNKLKWVPVPVVGTIEAVAAEYIHMQQWL